MGEIGHNRCVRVTAAPDKNGKVNHQNNQAGNNAVASN
jgi:hypothetical protein